MENWLHALQSKLINFSSVQIKKLFNERKLSSSEERYLQEFWSQFNVDKTACKSYVEHL